MTGYEYHVVAAPRKGKSGRGVKGGAAKFANAISSLMNELAAEGWEYLRADTLPCEERQGLTSKTVKYHSMLVFRRPLAEEVEEEAPLALTHQDAEEPEEKAEPRKEPALSAEKPAEEDSSDTEDTPSETTAFASSRSGTV